MADGMDKLSAGVNTVMNRGMRGAAEQLLASKE